MAPYQSVAFSCVLAALCIGLSSCSTGPTPLAPPHSRPAVNTPQLSFVETEVAADCEVFAHLIISVPATYTADQIRQSIDQFGAGHGAELILLGLARQAAKALDSPDFASYGPQTPYSFRQAWPGWKFGFTEWNKGGPLLDFGVNHLSGNQAPFTVPISIQAALLSCPSLRGN